MSSNDGHQPHRQRSHRAPLGNVGDRINKDVSQPVSLRCEETLSSQEQPQSTKPNRPKRKRDASTVSTEKNGCARTDPVEATRSTKRSQSSHSSTSAPTTQNLECTEMLDSNSPQRACPSSTIVNNQLEYTTIYDETNNKSQTLAKSQRASRGGASSSNQLEYTTIYDESCKNQFQAKSNGSHNGAKTSKIYSDSYKQNPSESITSKMFAPSITSIRTNSPETPTTAGIPTRRSSRLVTVALENPISNSREDAKRRHSKSSSPSVSTSNQGTPRLMQTTLKLTHPLKEGPGAAANTPLSSSRPVKSSSPSQPHIATRSSTSSSSPSLSRPPLNINDLNPSILLRIFRFLPDFKNNYKARLVCQKWNHLLRDPLLLLSYPTDHYDIPWRANEMRHLIKDHCKLWALQPSLNSMMRSILVDWLQEVAQDFLFQEHTVFLAIHLINKFLCRQYVARDQFQLLGITCLWVAAKLEEIEVPLVDELVSTCDKAYTKRQMIEMESSVLQTLNHDIAIVSPLHFLEMMFDDVEIDAHVIYLSKYLANLSLLECKFVDYCPSVVAAAAFVLSVGKYSPVKVCEHFPIEIVSLDEKFFQCLRLLGSTWRNRNVQLSTLTNKYSKEEFKKVAIVTPSPENKIFEIANRLQKKLGSRNESTKIK